MGFGCVCGEGERERKRSRRNRRRLVISRFRDARCTNFQAEKSALRIKVLSLQQNAQMIIWKKWNVWCRRTIVWLSLWLNVIKIRYASHGQWTIRQYTILDSIRFCENEQSHRYQSGFPSPLLWCCVCVCVCVCEVWIIESWHEKCEIIDGSSSSSSLLREREEKEEKEKDVQMS